MPQSYINGETTVPKVTYITRELDHFSSHQLEAYICFASVYKKRVL